MHRTRNTFCVVLSLLFLFVASSAAFAADASSGTAYSQEELDQLVSPIALYSDELLAQVFAASTYPLEIVEAERWYQQNSSLKGSQLQDALNKQDWDPSVKSLVTVPDVLKMMNDNLDWTQDLGDAFLGQQKDLMNSVQRLRAKAKAAGNLKSTAQQTVRTDSSGGTTIIQITSPNPDVIYVPSYDPAIIYGPWPYPAYPPYPYYAYSYAGNVVSFGLGLAVGYAFWGDCDWHNGDININVNRYNHFNHTDIRDSRWNHNPYHRRGVGYKNPQVQQRFQNRNIAGERGRDSFRGHEPGFEGGASHMKPGAPGTRPGAGGAGERRIPTPHNVPQNVPHAPNIPQNIQHAPNIDNRHNIPNRAPGAFDGVGTGGSHIDSVRGHQSIGSQHMPAPHFGGGMHGGGGVRFRH